MTRSLPGPPGMLLSPPLGPVPSHHSAFQHTSKPVTSNPAPLSTLMTMGLRSASKTLTQPDSTSCSGTCISVPQSATTYISNERPVESVKPKGFGSMPGSAQPSCGPPEQNRLSSNSQSDRWTG